MSNPTPVTAARFATMRRIRNADAPVRWERQRRANARKAGYRGPLSRADLAARVNAALAGEFCTRDECQIRHHAPHTH